MDDQPHQTLLKLTLQSLLNDPPEAVAAILLIVVYERNHEPKQLDVLIVERAEDLADRLHAELDEIEGVFGLEASQQVDLVLGQGQFFDHVQIAPQSIQQGRNVLPVG